MSYDFLIFLAADMLADQELIRRMSFAEFSELVGMRYARAVRRTPAKDRVLR